ncbi:MAG: hypothetical protein HUJ54_15205, partial [Erysipelotrichaceae bacterium]|nr:hypothetical protein [Erysipelotrichaceae bacterium]
MKIEILELGKMKTSGHSLLRALQDTATPALDLFVRESVQNSLDAVLPGVDAVKVSFKTGDFIPEKLNGHLEGITEQMNLRHSSSRARYLAIRDCNTTGLTGPISYRDPRVASSNHGNYLNLVYEINREQQKEGSGGSWG